MLTLNYSDILFLLVIIGFSIYYIFDKHYSVQRLVTIDNNDNDIAAPIKNTSINLDNKYALLIGINYGHPEFKNTSTVPALSFCVKDSVHMDNFIQNNYLQQNRVRLNSKDETIYQRITKEIQNLIAFSKNNKNSQILFYYSGHGHYCRDASGDEIDLRDEMILPSNSNIMMSPPSSLLLPAGSGIDFVRHVDYRYYVNCLIDDDLKASFIDKLDPTTTIIIVTDACNSGTMFDLNNVIYPNLKFKPDIISDTPRTGPRVLTLSGCLDSQYSYESSILRGSVLTMYLIEELKNYRTITWKQLQNSLHDKISSNGYQQYPVLSTNDISILNENAVKYF